MDFLKEIVKEYSEMNMEFWKGDKKYGEYA